MLDIFLAELFLQSVRIGAEEEIDDTKGLKPEEIEEMNKNKEAKAQAQILEMVRLVSVVVILIQFLYMTACIIVQEKLL